MAQPVNVLPAANLSMIPEICVVEGENLLKQVSSDHHGNTILHMSPSFLKSM